MDTTPEENVARMRRLVFEVQEKANYDLLEDFLHPDWYNHTTEGDLKTGVANVRMVMQGLHAIFSDIKMRIDHCISQGNMVATNKVLRGRQVGEWMGVPASNMLVEFRIMDWVTVVDGKFKEHWAAVGPLVVVDE